MKDCQCEGKLASYEIRSIGAEFRIPSPQKSMPIRDFAAVVSADREAISRKPYQPFPSSAFLEKRRRALFLDQIILPTIGFLPPFEFAQGEFEAFFAYGGPARLFIIAQSSHAGAKLFVRMHALDVGDGGFNGHVRAFLP
jgi:hypothetical protein